MAKLSRCIILVVMGLPKIRLGWSRRRKVTTVVATIIILMVAAILLIIKILNSPAVGTVKPTTTQSFDATTASSKPGSYSDKYINFTYPGNLELLHSQKSTGYLDTVTLYSNKTDHTSEHAAISVVRGTIADDPSINYRRTHKELYKEQTGSDGIIIFTKTKDGNEKTAYIPHDGLLASVSLTVLGSKDLSSDFAMILNSFHWK